MAIDVQMGAYRVRGYAAQTAHGKWCGSAQYTLHKPDAVIDSSKHFEMEFDTEAEAVHHALEQMELRIRNGDI